MRTLRAALAALPFVVGLIPTGVAQTTAGSSTQIVVPVTAQTTTFQSEVTVYNPNGAPITVDVAFYEANNSAVPGLRLCTDAVVPANRSVQFSLATQCTLGAGNHFGLLVLTDSAGTNPFYAYSRVQNFAGIGFSTEGFPVGNFNNQASHATGLKRTVSGLIFQTNCFAGALAQAVTYTLKFYDDATGTQIGSTINGSLSAFEQVRYLDVMGTAGNQLNVRAEFASTNGANLVGFCTVQDNASFGADFRIAKSYGTPGTVTSLAPGTGITLTPNPITTTGTVAVDTTAIQSRVSGTCGAGSSIRAIAANGTVTCETDDIGTGTVTNLTPGTGITLTPNPITATGSIAVNTAAIQARVTGSCAVGSSIRVINNDGTVSCETDDAGPANAFVQGGNAFGTNAVLGTTDNQPLDLRVNNSRVMRYQSDGVSPSLVGGHPNNSAAESWAGQTVAGGGMPGSNCFDPPTGTQTRSCANHAVSSYATVGGGFANVASGSAGTVGGGGSNTASGGTSTVGGGGYNTASADYSTVGGGRDNTASGSRSTVGGGENNKASQLHSTVGGGWDNTASAFYSTVGGGVDNTASANNSTVGGGHSNTASGTLSTVGGGDHNTASGLGGTVGGGRYNTASGAYSFAAGRRAKTQTAGVIPTIHHGTFVFADQSDFDFNTAATNEFAVRATGGVRFVTAIDGTGAPTRTVAIDGNGELGFGNVRRQMINLWAGADPHGIGIQNWTQYFRIDSPLATGGFAWYRGGTHSDVTFDPGTGGVTLMTLDRSGNLSTAGTVNGVSDVARKTAFLPADPGAILDRVVGLPITTWRYREDAAQVRHIGPTAQDFAAAFAVGADDKHIAMVDADGVALAAIQGLNAKLEAAVVERDATIRTQQAAIERLEARLEALEARLADAPARVAGRSR